MLGVAKGSTLACRKDDMMQHPCQMPWFWIPEILTTDDQFSKDASFKALVNTPYRNVETLQVFVSGGG